MTQQSVPGRLFRPRLRILLMVVIVLLTVPGAVLSQTASAGVVSGKEVRS